MVCSLRNPSPKGYNRTREGTEKGNKDDQGYGKASMPQEAQKTIDS